VRANLLDGADGDSVHEIVQPRATSAANGCFTSPHIGWKIEAMGSGRFANSECLGDDVILEFVEKKLAAGVEQHIHDHIALCAACRQLVAEAGKYYYEGQSHAETAVRAIRAPSRELSPGQDVGRYTIVQTLGRGGMGVVYEAYDPQLRRRIALKLVGDDAEDAAEAHARTVRLLREAQAMAQLSDPNVVSVFDAGELDGHVYIAMELVAGVTLDRWRAAHPRSIAEITAVFEQAARGLAAAHAAGLVHRDFKPQNVLVGNDGRVRVTDFGLARETATDADEIPSSAVSLVRDALTRTGALCGTPAYMAPEQFEGSMADPISDQFNFCVTFYEALYGERPFKGETLYELAREVLAGHVEPPRDAPVPADVRAIVMRGLRGAREERFPSMTALIDALVRVERVPVARRRTTTSKIAVALAAVAGLATITWYAARAPTAASPAAAPPPSVPSAAITPAGSGVVAPPAPAIAAPEPAAKPTPTHESRATTTPPATSSRPAKRTKAPTRVQRTKKAAASSEPQRESRPRSDALKPLEEE
jgi:serine/threonine protein kinase